MIPPTNAKGLPEVEERTPSNAEDPMTSQQADVLRALADKHGETFQETLTQAEAEARINELKAREEGA